MARERSDLKGYEGRELKVIAWLWARTVKSPNPAYAHVDVPLVSNFMLSTKKGKEAWVEPIIEGGTYRFVVPLPGNHKTWKRPKTGQSSDEGSNFGVSCLKHLLTPNIFTQKQKLVVLVKNLCV